MALYHLQTAERFRGVRVSSLLTTFTDGYDRVSDHGIRRILIERQAEAYAGPERRGRDRRRQDRRTDDRRRDVHEILW